MSRRLPIRWAPGLFAMLMLALWPALNARAANLALGKPAFASYNSPVVGNGTDATANLTDGDFGTVWTNAGTINGANDKVGVDLGSAVAFRYVRVYWQADHLTGFTIDVADSVDTDPSSFFYGEGDWNTVYTRTADPAGFNGANDFIDIGTQTHRFVRISGNTSSNTSNAWGLNEIQVLDLAPGVTGIVQAGATPVANAIVQLYGPSGGPAGSPPTFVTSTKTDASGNFAFTGIYSGNYVLNAVAPGQYGPVGTPVVVADANVVQNLTLTTVVHNSTAPVPAYGTDFIASPTTPKDGNATANSLVLPSDELPAGDTVWNTATALPAGGTLGSSMPTTLNFHFPPTADGKNNALSAQNITLPVSPGHYTALYALQVAGDQAYETTATLNYGDGTSAPVTTSIGNSVYHISLGTDAPGVDEVVALTVNELYNVSDGTKPTQTPPFRVFMRTIQCDPTKVLKSISFGPGSGNNGTLAKGYILAYSADSTDIPAATGNISGTIKAPNGTPVKSALVTIQEYPGITYTTNTTGTYAFNGLPPATYTIGAAKSANYALKTISVPLAAGQILTGQDIQFTAPVPVVTDFLSSPTLDMVSSDANMLDFTISDFALGREFIPTGLYSPDLSGNDPNGKYVFDANAPSALAFQFGDIQDSPVTPGSPGYPIGAAPNAVVPHGATFLAPPAKVFNAYFCVVGFEGQLFMTATLRYTDGTESNRVVTISDWFGTPSTDELPYLVMRGRHNNAVEANVGGSIKINVLRIPVDSTKTLKEITFDEGSKPQAYPCVLAVSWETDVPQDASSDVTVHVTTSGGAPAAGAVVILGPYDRLADANGDATFRGIPAHLTLSAGAYLSGLTKQARVEGNVIPANQKLPTPFIINITLPAEPPVFVQLPLPYDYDAIAATDQPGDFKGNPTNDWAFTAENLPAPGTLPVVGNVPYLMPHTETAYMNVMRQNGQTVPVAPGHYSSLDMVLVGQGLGGNFTRIWYVTFNYSDGTSERVQFGVSDWVMDWPNPVNTYRRLFFRQLSLGGSGINPFYTPNRRQAGSADQTLNCAFLPEPIPCNAGKTLVSFTLQRQLRGFENDDCSILAATLEANDTTAMGTITGTVIGKPLTNNAGSIEPVATAVPLGRAMVILDDGHASYTDANGNFTITNAPLGTGTLKVVPFGTGILSSTKPITVTAGANSAGTIDAGAGVTSVYSILGSTNSELGMKQVQGYDWAYSIDAGRANNKMTITDSGTSPIFIAGKDARVGTYASDHFYFKIDRGWLDRGFIGSVGRDPASFSVNGTTFVGNLAPRIYMKIEYLDRGTDIFGVNYGRMEGWVHPGDLVPTVRMTDNYRTFQKYKNPATPSSGTEDLVITKTNTNTWKTVIYDFDPNLVRPAGVLSPAEPFGAYQGQNLQADFRINSRNSTGHPAEVIRSVQLSVVPNIPPLPSIPSALDALRIAAGLTIPTSAEFAANNVVIDGVVDLKDAVKLVRKGYGK